jgi:hypothetical protein
MINKHKTQVVASRKSNDGQDENTPSAAPRPTYDESSEEDEATTAKKDEGLFANTNAQEAQTREKKVRDQLSEVCFAFISFSLTLLEKLYNHAAKFSFQGA